MINKKLLKKLIIASYSNGELNKIAVAKISDKMDRALLKQYIKALKASEKIKNVYIESPFSNGKKVVEMFRGSFPGRIIKPIRNSSLIAGVKINYNDDVYEISLKNNLDNILNNIEQDND